MRWIVVVPLKPAGARKTRLSAALAEAAREALAAEMAAHVLAVAAAVPGTTSLMLSRDRPGWWQGAWQRDDADGLDAAVAAVRDTLAPAPIAIVHADLPLLEPAELAALLAAAEAHGAAIAPDRHGSGTNAVALADARPFRFGFGPGSFAFHLAQSGTAVRRPGLALDIDTPADLALLRATRT